MCNAAACHRDQDSAATSARSVEEIADEYLSAMLQRYPEYGTYYDIAGASHDRLSDNSLQALAAWQEREDAWLAVLDAVG
jgi:cytochrome c553